jgi:hypothetical protein
MNKLVLDQVNSTPNNNVAVWDEVVKDFDGVCDYECISSKIHDLVSNDMIDRNRVGISKYGTPLQPHNGRDALLDAYQELLDLVVYMKQAMIEAEKSEDKNLILDTVRPIYKGGLYRLTSLRELMERLR